jgi:hypothetical protein
VRPGGAGHVPHPEGRTRSLESGIPTYGCARIHRQNGRSRVAGRCSGSRRRFRSGRRQPESDGPLAGSGEECGAVGGGFVGGVPSDDPARGVAQMAAYRRRRRDPGRGVAPTFDLTAGSGRGRGAVGRV